jgi:uncharacterized membrane protein (DUF373 family)
VGQDSVVPDVEERPPAPLHRIGGKVLAIAEDVVYVGIAVLLVATAGVLLVVAAGQVIKTVGGGGQSAAIEVLDTLLLLFIIVELLFAVRSTLTERQLVAEPFLLVGILASIKEIVVLSVKAAEDAGKGEIFTDQLWQIGVLGVLVLALAVAAWLLRIKEREPAETDDTPREPARR